jgi:glycosyltransferase involved in cell wall biosynthesis
MTIDRARVLLVCNRFPFYSQTFITRKVLGLLDRGWDVQVACRRSDARQWALFREWLPKVRIRDRVHVTDEVKELAARLGPSIVHFEFGTQAARVVDWPAGVRTIVSFRGSDLNTIGLEDPEFYADVWRRVTAVHLHPSLLQQLVERGCPAEIPRFIGSSGCDTEFFKPAPRDLEVVGSPERPLRVLTIARVHWAKGHRDALLAIREVLERGIRCRYTIVGSPDYEEAQREFTFWRNHLGLQHVVDLLPACAPSEVRARMQAADLLLHASVAEGSSNTVLEAQAMELPVVGTQAVAGEVEHGETGVITPLGSPSALAEGVLALASDAELRARYGRAGRARVLEQFSRTRELEAVESMYDAVLQLPLPARIS